MTLSNTILTYVKEEIRHNIYYYNNAEFVVKFQKFCGLKRKNNDDKASEEEDHVIGNKFLYYLFSFGSICGEEFFGIIFFTWILSVVDVILAFQVILYWGVPMVIGSAMKDYYRIRRPNSPKLVRLEKHHSGQYGMPSTHSIGATAISAGIVLSEQLELSMAFRIAYGLVMSSLVGLSRIFMGVHGVADVGVGVLLTLGSCTLLYPCEPTLKWLLQTPEQHHWLVLIIVSFVGIVMYHYPHESHDRNNAINEDGGWNSVRAECFTMLGGMCGVLIGIGMDCRVLQSSTIPPAAASEWTWTVVPSLIRFLLAVAASPIVRIVFKPPLLYLLNLTILRSPPSSDQENYTVWRRNKLIEVPYNIMLYGILCFVLAFVMPRFSVLCGLGRIYLA